MLFCKSVLLVCKPILSLLQICLIIFILCRFYILVQCGLCLSVANPSYFQEVYLSSLHQCPELSKRTRSIILSCLNLKIAFGCLLHIYKNIFKILQAANFLWLMILHVERNYIAIFFLLLEFFPKIAIRNSLYCKSCDVVSRLAWYPYHPKRK